MLLLQVPFPPGPSWPLRVGAQLLPAAGESSGGDAEAGEKQLLMSSEGTGSIHRQSHRGKWPR